MFRPKPGYRLEIHVLKSHAASNLNRNEVGQPKSIDIGGFRRLMHSSQSEKFSIRHSHIFKQFLEEANSKYGATPLIRTRRVTEIIRDIINQKLIDNGLNVSEYDEDISSALTNFTSIFQKKKSTDDATELTTQLISFSKSEIDFIVEQFLEITPSPKVIFHDIHETLKALSKERSSSGFLSPEIQLFGRFTTASTYFRNVDQPLQVAPGFTVHESRIEQDYWTAVDDFQHSSDQQGSAHLDSRSFGAGVFYHYYCLDVPTLSKNMADAFTTLKQPRLINLITDLIAAFLYAVLCRNPVGNQTNYANNDLPFCTYITYGNAFPYSAQCAFEQPVKMSRNGGFTSEAKKCFAEWVEERKKRYGIFCGFEHHMGLDDDTSLECLVESTVQQTIPTIEKNI